MTYEEIIILDKAEKEIYKYLPNLSLFDDDDVKIQPSSYELRNHSGPLTYIFYIDFLKDEKVYSVNGIVRTEENGYNFVYSTSLDNLVKSDSFKVEDVVKRRTTYPSKDIVETKEFDKEIFFTNKTYKKN